MSCVCFRHIVAVAVAAVLITAVGQAQSEAGGDGQPPVIDTQVASKLVVDDSAPEYPPVAKINFVQGPVVLRVTVGPHGRVERAHVLQGNALLAVSALDAVRRWVYQPLTTALGPTAFITTVRLKFVLSNWDSSALTPKRAEKDFLRQVKPPVPISPADPRPDSQTDVVRMRLLIDERGRVVDRDAPSSEDLPAQLQACDTIGGWRFHPARWGNNPVASYVSVDVPVRTATDKNSGTSECR